MRPGAGITFGGRYELQSRIAIGGMGEVWQATDLVIGRQVAIKILKDEYLGDPGFLERFRAEARHAALVNHEGIANVYDYGEEEGSAYLVMELVPGEALSTILERERQLPTDTTLDLVSQTANALQAAHAAGLVHRDIKPGNLLITPDGHVKITDFGIARIADQVPLTATGQVMGTVQYLSPEQASGHPASPATDVYSLGIVAYEALAGRRPFTGESQVAIAMAQINETPPELPATIAEPVRNLVYASIAKNPADRPQTAAHLARAATALRYGDIHSAAAAVPGVLGPAGANPNDAATMLMPSAGRRDATTMLLPSAGAVNPAANELTTTEEEPKKKRSPWTWPLIVLIAIFAVALVGTLIALLSNQNEVKAPQTTVSRTPTPSATPTPPPVTTAPSTVAVAESDYVGMSGSDARAKAEGLKLVVNVQTGNAASDPEQVEKVYAVNPTGNLPIGSTLTLTVYGDYATPNQAATPRLSTGDPSQVEPFATGGPITVSWPQQSCPSGQNLSGYTLTLSGGNGAAIIGGGTLAADATSAQINPGASGSFDLTLMYYCGQQSSPVSAPLTITVVSPQTASPSPGV